MSDTPAGPTVDELLARLADAEATIARLQAADTDAQTEQTVAVIEAQAAADVERIEAAADAQVVVIEAAVEAEAAAVVEPEPVVDELLDDDPEGGDPVDDERRPGPVHPQAEHWLFKPLW